MLKKILLILLACFCLSQANANEQLNEQTKASPQVLTLFGQTVAACFEEVPIEAVLIVQLITGGYTAYPAGTTCESLGAGLFIGVLADALGVNIYGGTRNLETVLCLLKQVHCQAGPYKAPQKTTLIEFHHARLNHYFMTADPLEAAFLDRGGAGGGWVRTGESFPVLAAGTGLGSDVCRFYSSPFNSHFYTAERSECAYVRTDKNEKAVWAYEGMALRVGLPILAICPGSGKEVFRLHNNRFHLNDGNHRYTTRASTVSLMVLMGWKLEGTVFCTVP